MFKSYKKFVIYSLLIPLPFILFLGVLLYVYDPLQLYHEPWFRKKTYHDDMRIQAKGIIDYNDFDSVILGTSMMKSFSAIEAKEKLGGEWVNLSILGSTLKARSFILNYLLKHQKVKNVIISIDYFTLVNYDLYDNTTNFDFLYTGKALPFKIYLNTKFLLCALKFSIKEKCIGKYTNLEDMKNWITKIEYLGGFANWIKYYSKNDLEKLKNNIKTEDFKTYSNIDISEQKKYIMNYLLKYIQKNNNVNFHLVIPVSSRLSYKMKNVNRTYNNAGLYFSKLTKITKWLICQTKNDFNVKIYGFDDLDYADKIENYYDISHHDIDMNSMQLDAIKNQTNILTPENMDEYFKIMEEKIKNYDLNPLIEQIKASGILDK
ncbi:hypothetical protein L8W41_01905 [Campylobacter sp. IFREMER_LSEM_CL1904]|uniref:hypothetical protein n=1 Tax=unclassified Campylobacter TaxID=2593542 RepID=UPI0021E642A4|nr:MULTISPECIES: hypothetical protein [unclassified Campylobacter]MCV3427492.1 hypothetical protein [Campylobacter sp. IFREMER_LSEM_CL1904]MCV3479615.1 hypothetical protein [Campylobacter sp. CNRCH_2015_1657]